MLRGGFFIAVWPLVRHYSDMVTFKNNYNSRHDKEMKKKKAAKKKAAEEAKKKELANHNRAWEEMAEKRAAFRAEFKRRHGSGKSIPVAKKLGFEVVSVAEATKKKT
jgi:hypothetical protein